MRKFYLFWAAALCMSSAFANSQAEVKRYDFENHYVLWSYINYLSTRTTPPMYDPTTKVMTFRDGIVTVLDSAWFDNVSNLDAGRLAVLDSANIDMAVVSSTYSFSELPPAEAARWATEANDSAYAAVLRHPTRLRAAMALPVNDVNAALAEMNRCSDFYVDEDETERVFPYWNLESNLGPGNAPLYDQRYDTLFAHAAELGVAIYLHPNTPTAPYLLDNGLAYAQPGLGYGQDVMKTLFRLTLSGLFDRHPNVRIIVGHYGEFLPYTIDRVDRMINAVIAFGGDGHITSKHGFKYYVRHRNIMFSTSGNLDERVYNAVKDEFGANCMVFGSDYPYEDINASVAVIDSMQLPQAEADSFWMHTADRYIFCPYYWDTLVARTDNLLPKKTPTVTGYDFEHHCYIPAFYDTLANRTVAPYYDPSTSIIYMHSQFVVPMGTLPITEFNQPRVDTMNAVGMQVAVMSSSEGICDLSESQAIPLARATNDSIYQMGIKFPGRFRGEMCLPVQNVDSALAEMRRCAKLGFRVWCAASNFGTSDTTATFIYDPQYEPLLAEAENLHITIYLHPQVGIDPDFQDFGYSYASASLGFTEDNMRAVTRLILNGTFDRYPNLRLIVPHLGEYFPFVMNRMDNRFGEWAKACGDSYVKNKHDISYYFRNHNILISTSGMMSKVAFDLAKEVVGVDGIVYASDYPYEDYKQQVDLFCQMDLTQEELNKIWGGNAEKYVFYDDPSAVENVEFNQATQAVKFLRNGNLYIRRGDDIFDAKGIRVN